MKRVKKIVTMLLCLSLLGSHFSVAGAADETDLKNWTINTRYYMDHKSMKLELGGVEKAQEATVIITKEDSEEVLIEIPFSITSASETFDLAYPGGKSLTAGKYIISIKDEEGRQRASSSGEVPFHYFYIDYGTTAYPLVLQGTLEYDSYSAHATKVSVEAGFQTYEGTINEEGEFFVEYPRQEPGKIVKLTIADDYGCYRSEEYTVKERKSAVPNIHVYREMVATDRWIALPSDMRLCAEIDGNIYYSEYGIDTNSGDAEILISYPVIDKDISEISVWVESKYDDSIEKETFEIEDCLLNDCGYNYVLYPEKAVGDVKANQIGQIPTKVSTTINGKEYSSSINADGTFELAYPKQKDETKLILVFSDDHGCSCQVNDRSVNNYYEDEIYSFTAFPNRVECDYGYGGSSAKGDRLYASVGGKTYSSAAAVQGKEVLTVSYPRQAVGTAVKVWIRNDNTTQISKVFTEKIESKPYDITVNERTASISGRVYLNGEYDLTNNVSSVYTIVKGKKYPCSIKRRVVTEDEEDYYDYYEGDIYYYFQGKYPKQHVYDTIKLVIEDKDGYKITRNVILRPFPLKCKLDKIHSGLKKISGKTVGGSSVWVTYNKKTYKGKAKKNGKFSIKVKPLKAGKEVSISIESQEGYNYTNVIKVKVASSRVSLRKNVFRGSGSVALTVSKGQKGDRLSVKIAGKTYTKKIKSNKKKQSVSIRLKRRGTAGSKISVLLKDRFGKKKDTYRDIVYYSNNITVGMSERNAALTTWGKPDRKNNFGTGAIQWVFESYGTTLYVYIRGGRVSSIQKLNYH